MSHLTHDHWARFNQNAPTTPHNTLQIALQHLRTPHSAKALDIGSGNGRDAHYLASKGFDVTAVDACADCARYYCDSHNVTFIHSEIESFAFERYALINASLTLPFLDELQFPIVWAKIREACEPGGLISGHFFGPDDWKVQRGSCWPISENKLALLCSGLERLVCETHTQTRKNQAGESVVMQTSVCVLRRP